MGAQVIVYGPNDAQVADFQRVAPEGVEVGWVDSTLSLDEQAELLQDAQVAIVGGAPVTVEVAGRAPNLKLVQTTSAGTDTLDKTALGRDGHSRLQQRRRKRRGCRRAHHCTTGQHH